jgi:hypothetical protein
LLKVQIDFTRKMIIKTFGRIWNAIKTQAGQERSCPACVLIGEV